MKPLAILILGVAAVASAFVRDSPPQTKKNSRLEEAAEARRVWEQAIAAKGGHQRLLKVRNLLHTYQTTQVRKRHWRDITIRKLLAFPDRAWVYDDERPTIFGFGIYAWNGERQTHYELAQSQGSSPQLFVHTSPPFPIGVLEALGETQFVHLMETRWTQPEPLRTYPARLGGVGRVDVVETVAGPHHVDYYLDGKTHLPAQVIMHAVQGDPVWGVTDTFRLKDYVEVGGIEMPRIVDANRGLGSGHEENQYEFNVDFDPEIFDRPPTVEDGPEAWRAKPKTPGAGARQ